MIMNYHRGLLFGIFLIYLSAHLIILKYLSKNRQLNILYVSRYTYASNFFVDFLNSAASLYTESSEPIQTENIKNLNSNEVYDDTREFYSIQSLKNANETSRFIKLVLVFDHFYYTKAGENDFQIILRYQKILTVVNSLFQPFNIFIALVDVIFWKTDDKIKIYDDLNIDETYMKFKDYAINLRNKSIDHMQLISWHDLIGEHFFPSYKTYEMCKSSVGVIWERMHDDNLITRHLAHILAYNIGLEDNLMLSLDYRKIHEWNSDTAESLKKIAGDREKLLCLNIKPNKSSLYRIAICGNNVTEPGEGCDCGLNKEECPNSCCNVQMCQPYIDDTIKCAYGECCDLEQKTCERKWKRNQICRPESHSCDNPERCDGESEFCPKNKMKISGQGCTIKPCNNIGSVLTEVNRELPCGEGKEVEGICNSDGICQPRSDVPPVLFPKTTSNSPSPPTSSYNATRSSSLKISTDSSSNARTTSPLNTHTFSLSTNSHRRPTNSTSRLIYSNSSTNFLTHRSTGISTILPPNTDMNFSTSSLPKSQTNLDSTSQISKQSTLFDNLLPAIAVLAGVILILAFIIFFVIIRRRLRCCSRDQDLTQTSDEWYDDVPMTNSHLYESVCHTSASKMQYGNASPYLNKDSLFKNKITKNMNQILTAIKPSSPQEDLIHRAYFIRSLPPTSDEFYNEPVDSRPVSLRHEAYIDPTDAIDLSPFRTENNYEYL